MIRGALHLHSTYSDGDFTLPELRSILLADGCRFALLGDHAEFFDRQRVLDYIAESDTLSDDGFSFVPGLEFRCHDNMHIVGYGVTALTTSTDPEAVVRHIRDHDGVAVLAHPRNAHFDWIEELNLDAHGIEVWNTKYDGRAAPRPETFALFSRLQRKRADLHAFCGLDLHWRRQFRSLHTWIEASVPSRKDLLAALASGAFVTEHPGCTLPSSGMVPEVLMARFERTQRRSRALRSLLISTKRVGERFGLRAPDALKAQLRRLF